LAMAEVDKIEGLEEKRQYTTIHPKVHAHVILTQMNIREGLLAFGEKVNVAILKELRQLYEKKELMLWQTTNMLYDERKRVLRYLMFLKEKRDGSIKHADGLTEDHNKNT